LTLPSPAVTVAGAAVGAISVGGKGVGCTDVGGRGVGAGVLSAGRLTVTTSVGAVRPAVGVGSSGEAAA
jgi:hypothetical protein